MEKKKIKENTGEGIRKKRHGEGGTRKENQGGRKVKASNENATR